MSPPTELFMVFKFQEKVCIAWFQCIEDSLYEALFYMQMQSLFYAHWIKNQKYFKTNVKLWMAAVLKRSYLKLLLSFIVFLVFPNMKYYNTQLIGISTNSLPAVLSSRRQLTKAVPLRLFFKKDDHYNPRNRNTTEKTMRIIIEMETSVEFVTQNELFQHKWNTHCDTL